MLSCKRLFVGLVLVAACPLHGWAQSQGAIAGTVRDNTGAVMPGVTVEVSSPVMIEKVRTAVTDGTGQYKITELDPGVYTVSFTLAGFSTVKRDGIELTSGFTANVSPELAIGSMEETITVSGASPIVDVQNTVVQRVLTHEVVDSIPTGKLPADVAILIPGMSVSSLSRPSTQDVGGLVGSSAQALQIHGGLSTDQEVQIEGSSIAVFTAGRTAGNTSYITPANASVQETNVDYAGEQAYLLTGGVRINTILKSGGNTFSGSSFFNATGAKLQSSNFTPALQAQGLPAPVGVDWTSDGDFGLGGPIRKDKLWFFGSFLDRNVNNYTGRYYDANLTAPGANRFEFVPDTSHQVIDNNAQYAASMKLTWQASPKNKFTAYYDFDRTCQCKYRLLADNLAPEAIAYTIYPNQVRQGTWTAPMTNKLLFEAGYSWVHRPATRNPVAGAVAPSVTDQQTGLVFDANKNYVDELADNIVYRGSVSYVTGAQSLKVGMSYDWRRVLDYTKSLGSYYIRINNSTTGVPNQVTYEGLPQTNDEQTPRWSGYAQDQWTLKRVTVNAGLRFDDLEGEYPALQITPNAYFKQTNFPAATGVLGLKNVNPRFGFVYDVSGDGKTAVKASLGRYNNQIGPGITLTPLNFVATTLTRTWNDSTVCAGCISGDYIPQGDPLNPAANGELGPSPNNTFGTPVFSSSYDPNWTHSWQQLDYNWEASVGVSHQLMPGVGLDVSYFRRWFGNFPVTDNTLVSASDYSPFCVTAPLDPRLPGGGGQKICGLDLNPNKVGLINNVTENSSVTGAKEYSHWQGFDVGGNVRPHQGVLFQGGLSTGKTITDSCAVQAILPESVLGSTTTAPNFPYCHTETPWLTQVKGLASFRLPWEIDLAAAFQGIPGVPLTANWTATNAQVAPSLGRNLSAGPTSTVTLNLIAPGSAYTDRLNQLDFRVARTFPFQGAKRIKGIFDLYNSLNANPVTVYNSTYGTTAGAGASWSPLNVLTGRLMKFEVQVQF